MPIKFACPGCGKRYQVKDELAGRKAKCQACGDRMRVPAPAAKPPPPAAPQPAPQPAPSDAISSLFDEEFGVAAAAPKPATLCPSCRTPLPDDGWICTACGLNLRTGEVLQTEYADEDDDASRDLSRPAAAGSWLALFIRRCVFSAIGATVGAVIWAVVAIAIGYQFSIIAILVGVGAGVGMMINADDETGLLSGSVAGAFALVGVFLAKIFIFANLPLAFGNFDELDFRRFTAAAFYTTELIEQRGLDPNQMTEAEFEAIVSEAEQASQTWDDAEIDRRIEAASAKLDARVAAAQEPREKPRTRDGLPAAFADENDPLVLADPNRPDPNEPILADNEVFVVDEADRWPLFFAVMFGPIDGLFILFAVGTAFRIGMGF